MYAFLIILLILMTINVFLLLFSLNRIDKGADKIREPYLFNKKKRKNEEASPFYGVYKKAM